MLDLIELWNGMLGLGREPEGLSAGQMFARACLVYVMTLVIVRCGKKRFMSGATAFDLIVGIVLGSIVSRAITGNAPLYPALAGAVAIMLMHWLFSGLAMRSHVIGGLIKGSSKVVARNGVVNEDALRRSHMTHKDLLEEVRQNGVGDLDGVAEARLERSGSVSVLKASKPPTILDVAVEDGVKTIRLSVS